MIADVGVAYIELRDRWNRWVVLHLEAPERAKAGLGENKCQRNRNDGEEEGFQSESATTSSR